MYEAAEDRRTQTAWNTISNLLLPKVAWNRRGQLNRKRSRLHWHRHTYCILYCRNSVEQGRTYRLYGTGRPGCREQKVQVLFETGRTNCMKRKYRFYWTGRTSCLEQEVRVCMKQEVQVVREQEIQIVVTGNTGCYGKGSTDSMERGVQVLQNRE